MTAQPTWIGEFVKQAHKASHLVSSWLPSGEQQERTAEPHVFGQRRGSSLFEAAAGAIAVFKQKGWAADALKPNAILRVEVGLPAVIHDVPLRAVEQWLRSTSASPKDELVKRRLGK